MTLQQEFQQAAPAREITLEEGVKMLFDAVSTGDCALVKQLIDIGVPVDLRNEFGDTPLMLAVHRRRFDIARDLLKLKADPNAKNNDGASARMYAARSSDKLTELLFGEGASCQGTSPQALKELLAEAVVNRYSDVV